MGNVVTSQLEWVSCSGGNYPANAVEAGNDFGGRLLVARALLNGILLPGKLHVGQSSCYVPWDGREHKVADYQVLVDPAGTLNWVSSSGGSLPPDAVLGGRSEVGEHLLVGRASHAGMTIPGKIHPSHKTCYIPFDGQEFGYAHYDVLVRSGAQTARNQLSDRDEL